MGTLALIGLGSNLGDREAMLDAAVAALAEIPDCTLCGVSSYHETAPVGGPAGQQAFLNAAAAIETTRDPLELLRALQSIEQRLGRVRTVRWGERTLDLDLLLFGDEVRDTPVLRLPHPRMALRRFVLAPMAEVAPGAVDPTTGRTVGELLANLDRRPSCLALCVPEGDPLRSLLFRRLVTGLSAAGMSRGPDFWGGDRFQISPGSDPFTLEVLEWHLDRWGQELRADRWTEALWDDRWLVSDFWFDWLFLVARVSLESEGQWRTFKDRHLEARGRLVAPTFVAMDRGYLQALRAFERSFPSEGYPGRDIPILLLEDVGSDPMDPKSHPVFGLKYGDAGVLAEAADAMAAQILVACEATRAG